MGDSFWGEGELNRGNCGVELISGSCGLSRIRESTGSGPSSQYKEKQFKEPISIVSRE